MYSHKFTKHPPKHPKKSRRSCMTSTERFFIAIEGTGLEAVHGAPKDLMNPPLQLEIDASIFQTYTLDKRPTPCKQNTPT